MSYVTGIHAADISKSSRLKAALGLLRQRGKDGATTFELFQTCNDMAPHTTIAELRANGINISPATYIGKVGKRRVFKYYLIEQRQDLPGQEMFA